MVIRCSVLEKIEPANTEVEEAVGLIGCGGVTGLIISGSSNLNSDS
jgi:hypothetical protein